MSVSFTAKNLAGDIFHLSYDASLTEKKCITYLRSLLYRTFDVSSELQVVWFVEDILFRIPVEGETLLVLFRDPYMIRLDIVDEESKTEVEIMTILPKCTIQWSPEQVMRWMRKIHSFRECLAAGNGAPSYQSDDEWIIYEQNDFMEEVVCILDDCYYRNGMTSIESLLDLREEIDEEEWQFHPTLCFRLTIGSHVMSWPLLMDAGEEPDATSILEILQEDNIVARF
jgi:hypothetical protein